MTLIDLLDRHIAPTGIGATLAGAGTVIINRPEFAAKAVGVALYGLAVGMFLLARPEEGYISTIQTYLRRRAHGKRQNDKANH